MDLTIRQRFAVVTVYLILIMGLGYYFSNNWEFLTDSQNKFNLLLIATGLGLILSLYITEPFFSKPVDVIARWVAIGLFLIGLKEKSILSLYPLWVFGTVLFITVALILILIHKKEKENKGQRIMVDLICRVSRPDYIFTILYFDILISNFNKNSAAYPIMVGFGFLLLINKPVIWLVKWLTKLISYSKLKTGSMKFIGQVIGHESEDVFNVELDLNNSMRQTKIKGELIFLENQNMGVVGIIISEKLLVGKKWVQVVLLRNVEKDLITFNLNTFQPVSNEKSIFSKSNSVYQLDKNILTEEQMTEINSNLIINSFSSLVGYVWRGTTINQLKFIKLFEESTLINKSIGEGSIVVTNIGTESVLYQLIDARTDEELLEYKDTYGFTVGTAQKLGKYEIGAQQLNTVKWLPEIYAPIFLLNPEDIAYSPAESIGRLPNTNYGITLKNPHELVTHNTAILGILGIGKSCLTFELLQKLIINTEVKIICIDLTNQYLKELPKYIKHEVIQIDLPEEKRAYIKGENKDGVGNNPTTWGNELVYRETLKDEIETFFQSGKRVLILNPDLHNVSKAASSFNITNKVDLTPSEKTRIICERLIVKASALGETTEARILIVFEEAHSLIPEWNSVSNDGDKNATNGIAKVILQGRKYGLGSMVITQRTANISKSILNQCNTIFALRVFDDTGKQFLENYIGTDYSNVLPTLEERHCIAIGKALKLKQPVIIRLNDNNTIQIPG